MNHKIQNNNNDNPNFYFGGPRKPRFDTHNLPHRFCPWDGTAFKENEIICGCCGSERTTSAYLGDLTPTELVARDPSSRNRKGRRWKKILYRAQKGFPDNYVDETFLIGLKKNLHARRYNFYKVLLESFSVSQQISLVSLFIAIVIFTVDGHITTPFLLIGELVSAIIGFAIVYLCISQISHITSVVPSDHDLDSTDSLSSSPISDEADDELSSSSDDSSDSSDDHQVEPNDNSMQQQQQQQVSSPPPPPPTDIRLGRQIDLLSERQESEKTTNRVPIQSTPPVNQAAQHAAVLIHRLQSILLLVATLAVMSPVLATLTDSITDDTIWALTILLMLVHLFFQDYKFLSGGSKKFTAPLSLNAAVFAAVLLSSRLNSTLDVLALMLLAVEFFALTPVLRHYVKRTQPKTFHIIFSILLFGATGAVLSLFSILVTLGFFSTIAFITFACPFWLIWIQKYKQEINGPWDEYSLTSNTEVVLPHSTT